VTILRVTAGGAEPSSETIEAIAGRLRRQLGGLQAVPVRRLLDLFDDLSGRLLKHERTRTLDGVMFLSAWLRRSNLEKILELNLNGTLGYLDGFVPYEKGHLAAKPHGLVAMWMAGNVGTLPMLSLVPALLTKNVCLIKLAKDTSEGMDRLMSAFEESRAEGISGAELLKAFEVVWFDHHDHALSEAMSLAADVKVMWGGAEAIRAISILPRQEHCVEIVFGPKYSLGIVDRKLLERGPEVASDAIASFVRDIAIFDQRACSSPQTIFIERSNRVSLRKAGELFAQHFAKLPPKPGLDPYTTMRILNARAEWALDESRDVIASTDGANWTVCMDREVALKEAVQSRTIFLTEIESWREIIPLLSHKTQSVGIAFAKPEDAKAFAEAATAAGIVRCIRPGLMNLHESPWDGKLFVSQLVRWVSLKP
jgi:hypothetical protein